jgi:hypothetical protein
MTKFLSRTLLTYIFRLLHPLGSKDCIAYLAFRQLQCISTSQDKNPHVSALAPYGPPPESWKPLTSQHLYFAGFRILCLVILYSTGVSRFLSLCCDLFLHNRMKKQRCGISDAGRTFERGESPADPTPLSPPGLRTSQQLSN